ncbi:MAG: PDDEXK nuclease domain-containing protein [Bacilli bacterium]|nr:PDDEXK nuclease domain-containing protein [Bacilli bacterium]
MNYYDEIKEKLLKNEIYAKVKDYSKERNKVLTYYEVGKLLSEAGKEYGNDIIGKYAEKLINEVGKKYNRSTLFRMKQFYNIFSDTKVATLSQLLTWSHYVELLPLNDNNEINYYIKMCEQRNLDVRSLRNAIKSKEYERLSEETKNKLITNEELKLPDLVPNPIMIPNCDYIDINSISEKYLQENIMLNISSFLRELGNGFSFIDNEYKIKIGNNYNYIDLLLYNVKFKCYVVIELKVTELKKEHIGQIQVYMNYIDKNVKELTDNKTIGIIICSKNNQFIIEYCSDEKIVAREFKLESKL